MARQKGLGGQPDHQVLILGGGFGGVYTALGLERQLRPEDRTEVTLINNENFFLFTPLLCEIVSSQIDTSHAINPIRRMFKRTRFVEGEAVSVDPARRCVAVRHPNGDTYDYPYDHLVVSLGARTGFFGMRDVQEHALTAKTLGDAIHLRNWAIQMLETADTERDPTSRAKGHDEVVVRVVVGVAVGVAHGDAAPRGVDTDGLTLDEARALKHAADGVDGVAGVDLARHDLTEQGREQKKVLVVD